MTTCWNFSCYSLSLKTTVQLLKVNFPSWPSALTFFEVIYLEMNFWSVVTHHKQLHVLYHFLFGSHEEILHLCDRCDSWSALLAVPFLILMSMLWPSDTDLCDNLQYLLDYTDPNNISQHIFPLESMYTKLCDQLWIAFLESDRNSYSYLHLPGTYLYKQTTHLSG